MRSCSRCSVYGARKKTQYILKKNNHVPHGKSTEPGLVDVDSVLLWIMIAAV